MKVKIKIPANWRRIRSGETIRSNDRFPSVWMDSNSEWLGCIALVGEVAKAHHIIIRRKKRRAK